jgi:hypothetical protein
MIDQLWILLPSMAGRRLGFRYTMLFISITIDTKGVRTDRVRISLGWVIACGGSVIFIFSITIRTCHPRGVMEKRGGYKVTRLTCKTAGVDGQNDRSSILPWVRPEIIYFFLLPISSFHMKYLHNAIDLESLL